MAADAASATIPKISTPGIFFAAGLLTGALGASAATAAA